MAITIIAKRLWQGLTSSIFDGLMLVGLLAWDVLLTLYNHVVPNRSVGRVVKKGLPGFGGKWPEYIPPREGDSRCSCPALNALANHGASPFRAAAHDTILLAVSDGALTVTARWHGRHPPTRRAQHHIHRARPRHTGGVQLRADVWRDRAEAGGELPRARLLDGPLRPPGPGRAQLHRARRVCHPYAPSSFLIRGLSVDSSTSWGI